jgi:hypothetical protein
VGPFLSATVVTSALALGVLAPASAGAAETVNPKRLAKQVAATVTAAYPDLPVTTVKCPKAIKRKPGTTAVCVATAGGLSLEMLVTVTDKKGGVSIESTQAVIAKARAEEFVRYNATLPVVVDCGPDAYIVRPPGSPFECTATFADGTVQQVFLSPSDVAGTVTITQVL